MLAAWSGCARSDDAPSRHGEDAVGADAYAAERRLMVDRQIRSRGIHDGAVLEAMATVPRHEFVPQGARGAAYGDHPLSIGEGQTISQPYIVALMTAALRVGPGDRVLELGTGSGYQAAVLAAIVDTVFTIEYEPVLARRSAETLARLGYDNVVVRHGDGWRGWPEHAPFDAAIVTFAAPEVPPALIEQLEPGGRLCIPEGEARGVQKLMLYTKMEDGSLHRQNLCAVRFVPVQGEGAGR
jgi:protein-L-isoaspartate(D-aspartate) O-methyltransferase